MLNSFRDNLTTLKNDIPYYHYFLLENLRYSFAKKKVINLLEDRNWIKSFNEFDKNGISLLPIDISEIIFNSENILDDNLNTKTSSNIINILSSSDWNEYGKNFRILLLLN